MTLKSVLEILLLRPKKSARELPRAIRLGFMNIFYEPQHFLYFLPDPQGQGSLRPTLSSVRIT